MKKYECPLVEVLDFTETIMADDEVDTSIFGTEDGGEW